MTHDPVCFAEVDKGQALDQQLVSEQNGRTFYFCSEACKQRFDKDPGAFMGVQSDLETTDDEPGETTYNI